MCIKVEVVLGILKHFSVMMSSCGIGQKVAQGQTENEDTNNKVISHESCLF